jgi:hypothetical protein
MSCVVLYSSLIDCETAIIVSYSVPFSFVCCTQGLYFVISQCKLKIVRFRVYYLNLFIIFTYHVIVFCKSAK